MIGGKIGTSKTQSKQNKKRMFVVYFFFDGGGRRRAAIMLGEVGEDTVEVDVEGEVICGG